MNLEWNVYRHDSNKQEIVTYNIFNHYGFFEDVIWALNEYKNKDEFAEVLRKRLLYYFWSRSEYEIVIGPWVGGKDCKEVKVGIYTQVMANWERFVDYVWSRRGSV